MAKFDRTWRPRSPRKPLYSRSPSCRAAPPWWRRRSRRGRSRWPPGRRRRWRSSTGGGRTRLRPGTTATRRGATGERERAVKDVRIHPDIASASCWWIHFIFPSKCSFLFWTSQFIFAYVDTVIMHSQAAFFRSFPVNYCMWLTQIN